LIFDNKKAGKQMYFNITHNESNNTLMIKPVEEMSNAVYDKYKGYFESMGGHWREKKKAFIFYEDILNRGEHFKQKEKIQFFPTPDNIAHHMVSLARLDNTYYNYYDTQPCILEPSAGDGQLLKFIDKSLRGNEYIIEPNAENAAVLTLQECNVIQTTFEEFYDKEIRLPKHITHVIMNPPFSMSRDIKHTMMAYDLLVQGGMLVSLISENSLYYNRRLNKNFKKWLKEHSASLESVPGHSFANSGTTIDTVIVQIIKEK